MAPGVTKNSDTVINNTLEAIAHAEGLITEIVNEIKACPINHLVLTDVGKQNGVSGKEYQFKIQITKLDKRQPRLVTRPKVLKNIV
ncbi:jg23922 [Pararge aegeria aegeria]|uniref:Jg23922 protein n=1 Tax=Pararge aegeria aegeria TaxID=348720 RepID=A0A8S4QHS9_9NEOP|nr:jg23922 [Pararge aegeria aegeria]